MRTTSEGGSRNGKSLGFNHLNWLKKLKSFLILASKDSSKKWLTEAANDVEYAASIEQQLNAL